MSEEEILKRDSPAARMLGREVIAIDAANGRAWLRYTARPEFLNRHGAVQGGFLAAMLDSATALALYAVLPPGFTGLTTRLDVAFLKPAQPGVFDAEAQLIRKDERDAQTAAELRDANGVVVARATATLRIKAAREARGQGHDGAKDQ